MTIEAKAYQFNGEDFDLFYDSEENSLLLTYHDLQGKILIADVSVWGYPEQRYNCEISQVQDSGRLISLRKDKVRKERKDIEEYVRFVCKSMLELRGPCSPAIRMGEFFDSLPDDN